MAKNILIVDTQQGFSTILAEGLNSHEAFSAVVVGSSTVALQTIVERTVDLVIIDLDIQDMSPPKLIQAICEAKETLPIMVTPPMGQEVPANILSMPIKGVVPKPFFVGDLPKIVGDALGLDLESQVPDLPPVVQEPERPARPKRISRSERRANRQAEREASIPQGRPTRKKSSPPPATSKTEAKPKPVEQPPEPTPVQAEIVIESTLEGWKLERLRKSQAEILTELEAINQEFRAEVILLTAGSELIASSGNMAKKKVHELALLVAQSTTAADQAAAFLGERVKQFEQTIHEGKQYRLFSYSLGEGVVLSVAANTKVPLGMLRHEARQTGKKLMDTYVY